MMLPLWSCHQKRETGSLAFQDSHESDNYKEIVDIPFEEATALPSAEKLPEGEYEEEAVNEEGNNKEEVVPQRDELKLPDIGEDSSIKILSLGSFHQDEVPEDAGERKWLGLFKNETGFYVRETDPILERVNDPIMDEFGEETGWEISLDNPDTCLLLISGIALPEGTVQGKLFSASQPLPGDTLYHEMEGLDYALVVAGFKRKVSDNWHEVHNYKLFIQAQKNDTLINQLIVAQPAFDDQMISILWEGDLDGDQRPDFIIDTSNHYNASSPSLFLSSQAGPGELVKCVAVHMSVGC